jgi:hypothetical protein
VPHADAEKEFVIYCDESDRDGLFYSNFYGGLIIGASQLDRVVNKLEAKKIELNLTQEVKWEKVTANYLEKYKQLINCFFEEVENNNLKVRIIFIRSANCMNDQNIGNKDEQYLEPV